MGAALSSVGTKKRSRLWMVVVGILLLLAIGGGAAYYSLSGFFNANGTWYGPMQVKADGATLEIETYMNVSTSLTGGLSGSGTFCLPLPFNNSTSFDYTLTGNRAFVLPGSDNAKPITLTAEYTVPVVFGITVPIGPNLTMHGNVANDTLQLTGGDSSKSTTLAMKHGSKTDFEAACKQLNPLG